MSPDSDFNCKRCDRDLDAVDHYQDGVCRDCSECWNCGELSLEVKVFETLNGNACPQLCPGCALAIVGRPRMEERLDEKIASEAEGGLDI